jgi:DNA-binding XRE family transcriptional regulator
MSGLDFKIERIKARLTQWEIARAADVAPYRISAFEQERIELKPDEIARLRAALTQAAA